MPKDQNETEKMDEESLEKYRKKYRKHADDDYSAQIKKHVDDKNAIEKRLKAAYDEASDQRFRFEIDTIDMINDEIGKSGAVKELDKIYVQRQRDIEALEEEERQAIEKAEKQYREQREREWEEHEFKVKEEANQKIKRTVEISLDGEADQNDKSKSILQISQDMKNLIEDFDKYKDDPNEIEEEERQQKQANQEAMDAIVHEEIAKRKKAALDALLATPVMSEEKIVKKEVNAEKLRAMEKNRRALEGLDLASVSEFGASKAETENLAAISDNKKKNLFGKVKDDVGPFKDLKDAIGNYKSLLQKKNLGENIDEINNNINAIKESLNDIKKKAEKYVQKRKSFFYFTSNGRERVRLATEAVKVVTDSINQVDKFYKTVQKEEEELSKQRDEYVRLKKSDYDFDTFLQVRKGIDSVRKIREEYKEKRKQIWDKSASLEKPYRDELQDIRDRITNSREEEQKRLNKMWKQTKDEYEMFGKMVATQGFKKAKLGRVSLDFNHDRKYKFYNLSSSKGEEVSFEAKKPSGQAKKAEMEASKKKIAEDMLRKAKEENPKEYAKIAKTMSEEKMLEATMSSKEVAKLARKEIKNKAGEVVEIDELHTNGDVSYMVSRDLIGKYDSTYKAKDVFDVEFNYENKDAEIKIEANEKKHGAVGAIKVSDGEKFSINAKPKVQEDNPPLLGL